MTELDKGRIKVLENTMRITTQIWTVWACQDEIEKLNQLKQQKMTSYQRRKQEIEYLKKEVNDLKDTLYAESKLFYSELKWLGIGQLATGVYVKGKIVEIHRQNCTPYNGESVKIEN